MNYALKSFSVGMGNASQENWDRTFGKKSPKVDPPIDQPKHLPSYEDLEARLTAALEYIGELEKQLAEAGLLKEKP